MHCCVCTVCVNAPGGHVAPLQYTLSELALTHPLPEFDSLPLYVGGDVGGGEITLLHTRGELEGCVEVVRGVHVGGIQAARRAVAAGTASPSDFRLVCVLAGCARTSRCVRGDSLYISISAACALGSRGALTSILA
jgi:hypothetical protein